MLVGESRITGGQVNTDVYDLTGCRISHRQVNYGGRQPIKAVRNSRERDARAAGGDERLR